MRPHRWTQRRLLPTRALTLVLFVTLGAHAAPAQPGFCLRDADGDGHPLFGNPEVKLNAALDALFPDNLYVVTSGAIGDLDGDGDLDAAVTHAWRVPAQNGAGWVTILLNDGDGIFRINAVYSAGDYASAVAIGDLNGDGLNDLAITNALSGQVSVLINSGAAIFPGVVSYPVDVQPHSIVIADLNADSHPDLAVANIGSADVSVLLNLGNGTFAPATQYPTAPIPDHSAFLGAPYAFGGPFLAVGDVDGINGPDLVIPADDGVSILLNQGAGMFGPLVCVPTVGSTWAVAIGDLDGDGDADLVTANVADSISVLRNSGGVTFAAHVDYSIEYSNPSNISDPGSVALGDIDADGDLDIAVGLSIWAKVAVFPNLGDGTLGPFITYSADEEARLVSFADLNADGHLDLAAFALDEFSSEKLCVLLNDGAGNLLTDVVNHEFWNAPLGLWVNPEQISFADLDNDGDLGVVVAVAGDPNISGIVGNIAVISDVIPGIPMVTVHYPVAAFNPLSLALGDMNGDLQTDIVVAGPQNYSQWSDGWVGVLLNQGDGSLGAVDTYATGGIYPLSVALADLDSDGDLDVVSANYYSSEISVLLNDGQGNLATAQITPFSFLYPQSIAIADFNADGSLDLAVGKVLGVNGVAVMPGNGDGSFGPGALISLPGAGVFPLAADLDGDGDVDLAVSIGMTLYSGTGFVVLLNDGTGTFANAGQVFVPGSSGGGLTGADIDADLDVDIVMATHHSIAVVLNNGDATFTAAVSYGCDSNFGARPAVGDLDSDGDLDAGTANTGSHNISVLWNRRCPTAPPHTPADLDGDGDVDRDDYAIFAHCMRGPGLPPGHCATTVVSQPDLDGDGDLDLRDAAQFMNVFATQ